MFSVPVMARQEIASAAAVTCFSERHDLAGKAEPSGDASVAGYLGTAQRSYCCDKTAALHGSPTRM